MSFSIQHFLVSSGNNRFVFFWGGGGTEIEFVHLTHAKIFINYSLINKVYGNSFQKGEVTILRKAGK